MRMVISILLFLLPWCGFIIFSLLYFYKVNPDDFFTAIVDFMGGWAWLFAFRYLLEKYQQTE